MNRLNESFDSFETTGLASLGTAVASWIGAPRPAIGCGKPLPVSLKLASMAPDETEARLSARLSSIAGQLPRFRTRLAFPEQGPAYRIVEGVDFDCPPEGRALAVEAVEAAFRSAPEEAIGAALYRLRMVTRGRDQRTDEDRAAEAVIWIESLRCWPGDVALHVIRSWTARPNGQWWPSLAEVEGEIRKLCANRMALLAAVTSEPKPREAPPADAETRSRVAAMAEALAAELRSTTDIDRNSGRPTPVTKHTPEQAQANLDRIAAENAAGHVVKASPQLLKVIADRDIALGRRGSGDVD